MPYDYVTVDVFTDQAFGGNPLAVVTDARGLDSTAMQRIAAEFGYSETTFILPPADPANTAQVRIFTPTREVPFAGHPNVGTALVVAWADSCLGAPVGDSVRFEEQAGLVPIAIDRSPDGTAAAATFSAPQRVSVGAEVDPALVAACCSLDPGDIDVSTHRPKIVSVGLPFVLARLSDRAALARARPDLAAFHGNAAAMGCPDIHIYAVGAGAGSGAGADIHARMFAPLDGVIEDPATGSANAALVGLLAHLDPRADCTLALSIAQGEDMGRPKLLDGSAEKAGGAVTEIRIGGGGVRMMSGTLHLDS